MVAAHCPSEPIHSGGWVEPEETRRGVEVQAGAIKRVGDYGENMYINHTCSVPY